MPGRAGERAGAAIFNPMASRRPSCSVRRGARQPQRRGGGCRAGGDAGIEAGEVPGSPSTEPSPPWSAPRGCTLQLSRTRSGESRTKSGAQRDLPLHRKGVGGTRVLPRSRALPRFSLFNMQRSIKDSRIQEGLEKGRGIYYFLAIIQGFLICCKRRRRCDPPSPFRIRVSFFPQALQYLLHDSRSPVEHSVA